MTLKSVWIEEETRNEIETDIKRAYKLKRFANAIAYLLAFYKKYSRYHFKLSELKSLSEVKK